MKTETVWSPAAPVSARWASALALLLVVSACGGPGASDSVRAPVHRFVVPAEGVLTRDMPVATVRDDTRPVLRVPPRRALVWPESLPDERGNRLLLRRPSVPPPLRGARQLLVSRQVKVGPSWLEPPPQVLPVEGRGQDARVRVEFPIPANPDAARVVLTAQAVAVGLVDLTRIESPAVSLPVGAELDFAIGVLEPEWGFDPVEFTLQVCDGERCEARFQQRFDPQDRGSGAWEDHRVDLSDLAGSVRHFRFEARRLADEAPFSFPLWANPTLYAPAPRGAGRNVILLSIDTLRADHLGAYGYARDTSPFIDERFGRGGTLFQHLVAAATITTPSHATMFTSLQPATHGTTDGMQVLPAELPTLAERVRAAGLDTAAFTEDGWLGVRHGFGRGFDEYRENKSANIMDPEGQADVTFGQARAWLEQHRDRHFFLFLHTFQVHTPYAPPARYRKLFASEVAEAGGAEAPSQVRWMADYDREIRYTDDELRRLFETIDALDLGDDTVFILTSDHGEAFLEHGALEHGARLDEEVLRVPLLFWGRGVPAGRSIPAPVAHIDLLPTILELLGLRPPASAAGVSLVPLLEGRGGEEGLAGRALFSEARGTVSLGPDRRVERFLAPAFGVRLGARKLSRYRTDDGGFRYEYYDLDSDPKEQHDLYRSRGGEAADLKALVDGYQARSLALRRRLDRGQPTTPQRVFLDPRQEEKLRALGYLE